MIVQANRHRIECTFQIGDMVYLKLQPYDKSSLVARGTPKLAAKYFCPYKILDKIESYAYKLDLPSFSSRHPVFHVSQLKVEPSIKQAASFPTLSALPTALLKPVAILDQRIVKGGNAAPTQWLIHWSNSSPADAMLEFAQDLPLRFPNFPLRTRKNLSGE